MDGAITQHRAPLDYATSQGHMTSNGRGNQGQDDSAPRGNPGHAEEGPSPARWARHTAQPMSQEAHETKDFLAKGIFHHMTMESTDNTQHDLREEANREEEAHNGQTPGNPEISEEDVGAGVLKDVLNLEKIRAGGKRASTTGAPGTAGKDGAATTTYQWLQQQSNRA